MFRTVARIALAAFAFAGRGIAAAYVGVPQTASGFSEEMTWNGMPGKTRKAQAARANGIVMQIAFSGMVAFPNGRPADTILLPGPIDLRSPLRIKGIAPVPTHLDAATMTRPAKPESSSRDFRAADLDRRSGSHSGDRANGQENVNVTLSCEGTGGTSAGPQDMVCEAGLVPRIARKN